jgi:hypothetical protein
MSNKSILEALADVQRKVNEQRMKNAEANWNAIQETNTRGGGKQSQEKPLFTLGKSGLDPADQKTYGGTSSSPEAQNSNPGAGFVRSGFYRAGETPTGPELRPGRNQVEPGSNQAGALADKNRMPAATAIAAKPSPFEKPAERKDMPGASAGVRNEPSADSLYKTPGSSANDPSKAAPTPTAPPKAVAPAPTPTAPPKAVAPAPAPRPAPAKQAQSTPVAAAPAKPDYGYAAPGSSEDTAANFFSSAAKQQKAETGQKAPNDFSSEEESGGKTKGKKSMKESALINAALGLIGQENMFEAAKRMKGTCSSCGKMPCQCSGDVKEELKGNQKKIDANHNGKVDAQDFKILRGKKKMEEESSSDPDMAAPRPGGEKKKGDIEFKPQEAPKSPIAPPKDAPMPPKKPAGLKEAQTSVPSAGTRPIKPEEPKKDFGTVTGGPKGVGNPEVDSNGWPKGTGSWASEEESGGKTKKKSMKEDIDFSEAELAHIASIMETDAPAKAPVDGNKNFKVNAKGNEVGTGPTAGDLSDETIIDEARGRPKGSSKADVNPNTDQGRDPRQHIQVIAGQAAAGRVMDFKHENGEVSKISPGMGRRITAHLGSLKPAEKQTAVLKMHKHAEGLKV